MTPPGCALQQPACQAAELPVEPILSRTAAATQDPVPAVRRVYQSLSHCTQCTTAGRPPLLRPPAPLDTSSLRWNHCKIFPNIFTVSVRFFKCYKNKHLLKLIKLQSHIWLWSTSDKECFYCSTFPSTFQIIFNTELNSISESITFSQQGTEFWIWKSLTNSDLYCIFTEYSQFQTKRYQSTRRASKG